MLKADDPVTVTLPASAWNQILGILSRGRYSQVAPLIGAIHEQGMAQTGAGAGMVTNGAGKLNSGDPAHVPD